MSEIRPFRLEVPQAELDDLQRRLAATRFPEAETAKVLVQFTSAATEEDVLTHLNIRSKTQPRNVQIAVGDGTPFFVHPEVLTSPVPLADFSAEVNTYLDAVRQLGATGAVPVVLQLTTAVAAQLYIDIIFVSLWIQLNSLKYA